MSPLLTGMLVAGFAAVLAAIAKLYTKINEHDRDLAVMKTQVSPLWATVQQVISKELHHPHVQFAEMDRLLEKLDVLSISDAERVRLKELLILRANDMNPEITESQRESAKLMIHVMEKVLEETSHNMPSEIKQVSVPDPSAMKHKEEGEK